MAKVKRNAKLARSKKAAVRKPRAKAAHKPTKSKVQLPDEPSKPSTRFEDYSLLIHGEKKIGKTSLFSQEERALFLMWDPPQKSLSILQLQMRDWDDFIEAIDQLYARWEKNELSYKTIVVDGVDIMYASCFEWVCGKLGIVHPTDENDFGKSWNRIKREFADQITRLLMLPCKTRFLCHSQWREVKTRDGGSVDKLQPLLSGQAEEVLVGLVDLWGAYCYDESDRALVIVGDESIGAGHRIDHRFRVAGSKEAVVDVPMGKSAKEGYTNLLRAFNNNQPWTGIEAKRKEERGTPRSKLKVKPKVKLKG